MKQFENSRERLPWIAAVLGLVMPGMGQIYNGEMLKGLSLFVIFLVTLATGFRLTVLLPDRGLIAGALFTLIAATGIYVLSVVAAYRSAKQAEMDFMEKPHPPWVLHVALWLLGSVVVTGFVNDYVKTHIIEAYKIVGASMEPVVLKGDRVITDKTAYQRMPPKRGDVIVFVYPDDRSKIYIKRIEALPGDIITREDGQKETVPHGSVYVLGDNRGQSTDSRNFGFVPLRDVIGKVRQVYYSSGEAGARWSRVGTVIGMP
ncbi:MAG: signal peptidase I [Deltaproteobacteria bacterium]|nr:signal peptidase I [Deltaproteobacteria bacterium]